MSQRLVFSLSFKGCRQFPMIAALQFSLRSCSTDSSSLFKFRNAQSHVGSTNHRVGFLLIIRDVDGFAKVNNTVTIVFGACCMEKEEIEFLLKMSSYGLGRSVVSNVIETISVWR